MSIAKTVTKLLKEVGSSFNEVPVSFDKESIWHDQYAIFIAEFDLFGAHFYTNNPYTEIIYDPTKLIEDFKKYLVENLPKGTTIEHWPGTGEWEICGPKYKEYYEQIQNALEEVYELHDKGIFEELWKN